LAQIVIEWGYKEIGEVIAMLDKVQYWLDLADDDVKAANLLLKGGTS